MTFILSASFKPHKTDSIFVSKLDIYKGAQKNLNKQ